MRLLESNTQPSWNAELVCRQSRLTAVVSSTVFTLLFVAAPAAAWWFGILPTWAGILLGLLGLLVVYGILAILRAAFRPTNWYLAIETDGLLINLRSYRNYELPTAQTVLHLTYDEIVSVKRHVTRVSAPSDDGTATWREQSLDVQVAPSLTDEIRTAISAERQRRVTREYLRKFVTVSGRANHVPVTVPTDGTIRIAWRTRYDGVRPSIKKVLGHLTLRVEQQSDSSDSIANWDTADDESLDDLILRMVENGDTISAVRVLVQRRGYSWTDAKHFVDAIGAKV